MKYFLAGFLMSVCLLATSQERTFVVTSTQGLYSVDLKNCSSNFIGSTGMDFYDIAVTGDGKLRGVTGNSLYLIDTTTAQVTFLMSLNYMGFDLLPPSLIELNDSTLLFDFAFDLYSVNLNASNVTKIGNIGYISAGDLSWYDNDLYQSTDSQLIKITLDITNSSILNVVQINDSNLPFPKCFGLSTLAFEKENNSIIGFTQNDVVKICQIDGSFVTICENIVPDEIFGAAALRLPVQNPIPIACEVSSTSNQNEKPASLEISPNPIGRSGILQIKSNVELPSDFSLRLISINGVTLFLKSFHNAKDEFEIDLGQLNINSGLIVVEVSDGVKQFHSKIVIE